MHVIAEKLSEELIRVFLAFHTLTGCDSQGYIGLYIFMVLCSSENLSK